MPTLLLRALKNSPGILYQLDTSIHLKGKKDEFSSVFNNVVDTVLEYSASSPTQQMETTKGTLFGTYNSVTGYFQNVKNYRTDEAKFNSIMSGGALGRAQATFDLCNDFARIGVNALN